MEHITGQTTLAELALLRGKFGITAIHLTLEHARPASTFSESVVAHTRVKAILQHVADKTVIGYGQTEAEALDEAFARLTNLVGQEISKGKNEKTA